MNISSLVLHSPVPRSSSLSFTKRGAEYVVSRSLHSRISYFGSPNEKSSKDKDRLPDASSIGEISLNMSFNPFSKNHL